MRAALGLVLLTTLSATVGGCGREPRVGHDVVVVTLDTTRLDRLGIYGYEKPVSPNLDRFALASDLYLRAYASSSWTLPTHASMFTGLPISEHGAKGSEVAVRGTIPGLPQQAVTVAELLSERGYATAAFLGAPTLEARFGLAQGFGLYDDDFSDAPVLAPGSADASKRRAIAVARGVGRPADEVTRRALAWVREQDEGPLFLFVNYFDPHKPYRPPDPCHARFAPGIPNAGPRPPDWHRAPVAHQRSLYDAEICFMDSQFGELMSGLRELGRFENAVIAVVADHGEEFTETGTSHGKTLAEALIRVPLFVKRPGQIEGRTLEAPFETRRLFHLLVGEAGGPPGHGPDDAAGPIVSELMVAVEDDRRAMMRAMIDWPWKLVAPALGEAELFDLSGESDPEAADLAGLHPDVRAAMEARLAEWVAARRPAPEAEPIPEDPELLENLRALGYVF